MEDSQKKILDNYDIIVHAYPNSIVEDIPHFLGKVDEITSLNNGSVIQLLDCDYICGMSHINQAISQSIKAFDEKQNFAKDLGLEICVRLSAQKQINKALKLLGIKNNTNILVIYINTTDNQIEMLEKLLSECDDTIIDKYNENDIIKAYNLAGNDNIIDQINEKIALLTLKS